MRVGWREWLALPNLGIPAIKVKIDTGARSSSIHAENIRVEKRDGHDVALFDVAPLQEHSHFYLHCVSPVLDERNVRSSNGETTLRLFVASKVAIGGFEWQIQLSLADRTHMRYPMLMGRQAMGGNLVVEPSRSYLTGRRLPHVYRSHGLPKKKGIPAQ